MNEPPAVAWRPKHNPWAIALTVTMATFMEVLDTSIANVSLPHMAGDLSVSQDQSTWVLTSYLVSNAIVLPISGWLASKIGRKRFYMICVAIFTISSFLCGIAPNLEMLVLFRVLQGIGGGGLGPSEQSILADTFEPAKRGMAFAVYGMAVVLAPAIGPTLGGFITDHYSWRWVFFINVPVGIASLFLSNKMVEDPPWLETARKRSTSIDYVGLFLITVGLGSLEVVLDKGQEEDWFASHLIVGFSIVAAVALVCLVFWELDVEHPIVDLRLLKSRNFAMANIMMMMLGLALFGTTVLLPQYTQTLLGYTAEQAGRALSPGGILIILMMPMIGTMVSKVDARYMVAFGFAVLAGSMFYMSHTLYLGIDFRTAVTLRLYQSAGMAFLFVPINMLSYVGIPQEKNNAVSGMTNLSRNMGGDIGIALATTLLARRSQVHQALLASHTSGGSVMAAQTAGITRALMRGGSGAFQASQQAYAVVYRTMLRQAVALAYMDVLWLFAAGVCVMVPVAFFLRKAKTGGPVAAH